MREHLHEVGLVRVVRMDALDRAEVVVAGAPREVHRREPAGTELLGELVVAEDTWERGADCVAQSCVRVRLHLSEAPVRDSGQVEKLFEHCAGLRNDGWNPATWGTRGRGIVVLGGPHVPIQRGVAAPQKTRKQGS